LITRIIILSVFAYLLGSIPTAYWIGKIFKNIDIRKHGSGNSGTTNTLRVIGLRYAIPTLIIDFCKGFAATCLAFYVILPVGFETYHFKIFFGILAVIGHVFPIFAGFSGGKGIATFAGAVTGISYPAILICLAIFIVVTLISRFISVASIIASMVLPVFFFKFYSNDPIMLVSGILIVIIIIFTHRKNLVRLRNGNENKINFKKKINY